ncbi:hypothetical protein QEH56_14480 [Pelagicoccus enzymogenes]|nr:hypothetical protein [Pelagicoccus enzymogenes]
MWHKGVETFRDDAHYLLCDYVDGPVVQRRLTSLANFRSNNYLKLFQQVLERFTFEMHVERCKEGGSAAPVESVTMRKPPRVHSKKDNVLDEVLDIVQLEEPSIEEILEMVKPRGWRAGEVERGRSKTKQVMLCPPGYNEPVYFSRDSFRAKLLAHKKKKKQSKQSEFLLEELDIGVRGVGNKVEDLNNDAFKAPSKNKGPEM